MTTNPRLEELARMLRPLSSPVRLQLLRYLSTSGTIEEIAVHLGISRQAARKHVDKLLETGALIKQRSVGKPLPVMGYTANPQALFAIYDQIEKLGDMDVQHPSLMMTRAALNKGRKEPPVPQSGTMLIVVRGLLNGRRFALDGVNAREWALGRDERCDFTLLYDPWVSKRHMLIKKTDARYVLHDLRSTNGTIHNMNALPKGADVGLKDGDIIGVGRSVMVFWDR